MTHIINNKSKKATVLIYSIILTFLSLTMGIIIMNNASILILNQKNNLLNTKINNNINNKINIFLKTIKEKNNDWGGFVDNLSWSWANIYCREQTDWTYLVEWDDGTKIWSDNIDDNCNSDNYLWNNNIIFPYPNNFEDNDNYIRKNINWLVTTKKTENIFWNNIIIETAILNNPNNNSTKNIRLWLVDDGKLFIDIDKPAKLVVVEYNKERYTNFREIKKIKTYSWNISWSWYIQENTDILSLNNIIDSNTYNFDFKDSWYLIFLINDSDTDFVNYNLSWINNSLKPIFLNPVNDSDLDSINFLWYDAIISDKLYISTKIKKITWIK